MKYRKKPVVIEAFQLGVDHIPGWFMEKVAKNEVTLMKNQSNETEADIKTMEGPMHANFGDMIIKGIQGELYPCKPDVFEATYESVEVGT